MSTSGATHGVVPIDHFSNHVIDFAQSDHDPALMFGGSFPFSQQWMGQCDKVVADGSWERTVAPKTLAPASLEEQRYIAMPPTSQCQSPHSASDLDLRFGDSKLGNLPSSDALLAGSGKASPREENSSAEPDDEQEVQEDRNDIKKTTHNTIEKRYRRNLKGKFTALANSIPSLRILSKSVRGEDTTKDLQKLQGLTKAHNFNKATVLSKATEYIRHLEKLNEALLNENSSMQARIAAFEKFAVAGSILEPTPQRPPMPMQQGHDGYLHVVNSTMSPYGSSAPAGVVPVTEDKQRIISAPNAIGRPTLQSNGASNPRIFQQEIWNQTSFVQADHIANTFFHHWHEG